MIKDKYIFLDLDGVINVEVYINAIHEISGRMNIDYKEAIMDEYGMRFCPTSVAMLKYIIEKTGAKIVISSTWRHSGLKVMQEMWKARNLPGEVVGITPSFINDRPLNDNLPFKERGERGHEIAHYIKEHGITSWVQIDDDDDVLPEQESHFVQTNERYGITFDDAEKAIKILNEE